MFFFSLLAFLLEHFFGELQQKMKSYKFAKPREVTLTSVCHHISAHLGYMRHWKSIYDYVRLRRNHEFINPIRVCVSVEHPYSLNIICLKREKDTEISSHNGRFDLLWGNSHLNWRN